MVTVLFTNSHLDENDLAAGRSTRCLVLANTVADEMADWAAKQIRIPAHHRQRVLLQERRACLVRMRLLRASLDCMLKEA